MSRIPTRDEVLNWIAENPSLTSKRDIAKAFGIKGAARIDLKALLRSLEAEGHLEKRNRSYRDPDRLPPVSVLLIAPVGAEGDVFARPVEWQGQGPEPRVLMIPCAGDAALGEGDRVLARVSEVKGEEHHYEGRLIRKIGSNPRKIVGIYRKAAEGGRIVPVDKKQDREWLVPPGATGGARDGELIEAEQAGPKGRMGLPKARIITRLGDPSAPKSVSLIAIHQHGIPDAFSEAALAEADAATPPGPDGREDLTALPLVTIDPGDARDHDDAVCAIKTEAGFTLWVAIADVAHYVRPGSALDREARQRGNSTYFPDRVVPMLPDRLSGDLCSLHEGVVRPCLAVEMKISAAGELTGQRFTRALMKSPAALTYEEVQHTRDGSPNARTSALIETVISPLYAAYEALQTARAARQPLDLDLPERRIVLSDKSKVTSVAFQERFDAHKLIEEFMVLANVAAARVLSDKRMPLLYRVHEEPAPEKLDALRETAGSIGLSLAKGQVLQTKHLNRLLEAAATTEEAELINISTLRAMSQAYYARENFGHFGLALRQYAHFTSPIRRYADLVVHRALIAAHGWGEGVLNEDGLGEAEIDQLEATAEHISATERRSMLAERDTSDRYLSAYLAERVGTEMSGRISGIARFGVFVKLDETGADGLVPIRELGAEYFHYDAEALTLTGSETGREIGLGQGVTVRLAEAVPFTGGLLLELLDIEGSTLSRGPQRRPKPPKRKLRSAKKKAAKLRKVTRRRR